MNKFIQRSYIQSRLSLQESATSIHKDLVKIHGSSAFSYMTVTRWINRFKNESSSLNDKPRSGRPVTETNTANILRIEALISENPRLSTYDLEELTSISHPNILKILHDHLGLRKVASRWIPHFLTIEQKQKRLEFCKVMLAKLETGEWRLDQILTGDESCFFHRKIEKRASCASWKKPGEAPDTVVRRGKSEKKTMFCILFAQQVLF